MEIKKKTSRSREAFCNAFIELSKTTPVENITVTALAEKSGYTRGAFYSQFESMDTFLKNIVDDEIENYLNISIEFYKNSNYHVEPSFPVSSILNLFEYVYSKRELYKFIFSNYNYFNTVDYFITQTAKQLPAFEPHFSDSMPDIDTDLYCFLSSYVQKACIQYWIMQDFEWSPKKLAEQCTLFYYKTRKNIDLIRKTSAR